jgi:flavin reductase (DIM6/NTAB) family NADH-FMN oxidoreductase RutF
VDTHRTAEQCNGAAAGLGPLSTVQSPSSDVVSADAFRRFMAGFPSGVAVVTAVDSLGNPAGMTCSSLCSVSLDPPTLLICLRLGSPTLQAVLRRSAFTLNLLHANAQSTAELFASGAADRFARVRWTPGIGGPRLTEDSHAVADCRVSAAIPGGDHMVVFGEVYDTVDLDAATGRPLLHGMWRYAGWPADEVDRGRARG